MRLKAVGLAGFRRLDPVVPDRTAFGAARKRKACGKYADDQDQAAQHDGLLPKDRIMGRKAGIFKRKPVFPLVFPWAECSLQWPNDYI